MNEISVGLDTEQISKISSRYWIPSDYEVDIFISSSYQVVHWWLISYRYQTDISYIFNKCQILGGY